MKVSKIFQLNKTQFELDFVDIDTAKDFPLFLDPYLIARDSSNWSYRACKSISSFFGKLIEYLRNKQFDEALEIFKHLSEPNETCLGLSQGKPRGHGMGRADAEKIFKSLIKSRAVTTGIVQDIEDFRIFVKGVDKDKLSDMVTQIIRANLISYTRDQCKLWGLPLQQSVPTGYTWNIQSASWENKYDEMLIIASRKYLLVPKRIVSYSDVYTKSRYSQHFVLPFLQNEHLRLNTALVRVRKNKKGQVIKRYVTKKSIIHKDGSHDKTYLTEFTQKNKEVFQKFKNESKATLSNETVNQNSGISKKKVTEIISKELKATLPGNDSATTYHRIVTGALEFLFFPHLTSPVVEKEIHEGRKRVDIVFDNAATDQFFFNLSHGGSTISCPFIFVECKNYSEDVKNPEIDQLAGRFSQNRGKVGLLVCRSIKDATLLMKRCKDTFTDSRGLIIPLFDSDLLQMLDQFPDRGFSVCHEILMKKYREIAL